MFVCFSLFLNSSFIHLIKFYGVMRRDMHENKVSRTEPLKNRHALRTCG